MRICGIDLRGADAIVVIIDTDHDSWNLVESDPRKISLSDSKSVSAVRSFKGVLDALFQQYQVDLVAIKQRNEKGKFAGGGISFKIEGLIQVSAAVPVSLISIQTVKSALKKSPVEIPNELNTYQQDAFKVAYTCWVQSRNDQF